MKQLLYTLTILFFAVTFAQKNTQKEQCLIKNLPESEEKWNLLLKKIDYYLYTKKNKDSVNWYLNLLILKNIKGSDSLFIAKKLNKKSILNSQISNYNLSISNAKEAIVIFEKYGEFYEAALTKRDLGNTYQLLFDNKDALSYFNQAEKLLGGKDRITLLIGIAAVHAQLNNLDKSIVYYNKAIAISKTLGQNEYLYNIYNGMAAVYDKNRDLKKTFNMLNKALTIATENNNYLGQIVCLHNFGYQYLKNKNYQQAKINFERAIILFQKTNNSYIKSSIYTKYANTLLNLNEIGKAKSTLNKAQEIFIKIGSTGRLPAILNIRAEIEMQEGNYIAAISTLEHALNIPTSNKITGIRGTNFLSLAKAYKETNNASKTFEFFEKYVNITDSITKRKKIKEIESVKSKFEVNEIEQDLKLKEQDLALLAIKNKSSNYRNLLLGLFSIGLLIFIYRQRKLNQAKRKTLQQEKEIIALNESLLKDHLKSKNSQITKYAIHIDERNKFLDTIKTQIKDISNLSTNNNQKSKINQLQYYIKDNISVQKGKVDLDKDIKNTEQKFRFKLEQKFPKLTEKEIVVCKLLSLDLSSKQIAQKMEITLQSVNNYRASIRKKIKLPTGGNLKRFLKKL